MIMSNGKGLEKNSKQWWLDRPWRQIQTNLRETDMLDIDAESFVKELQEFKATSVFINVAGIIASYPTKLPFHFQSEFLKGDSLEKIITACHDANISVIARTDFSKVRRPIYEAHPEWAYISPKGHIVDYNGDVHCCLNGDYQQKYAFEIMKECITALDVDGIFFNMGGYQVKDYSGNYHGICQCDSCRRKFTEMFKMNLPKEENMNDPAFRKYLVFKKRTLAEYQDKIYRSLKEVRPDLLIFNNRQSLEGLVRQESNTAVDRPLPYWQYSASDNTKWVVSSYPAMISVNTTVDFIDFPYRHVAISPDEQSLRMAQNLAEAGGLDYYIMGRMENHEDKSGYEGIKKLFHYHAACEKEYVNLTSKANIGLLNGGDGDQQEFRGWFRFLAENHFLFDTIMVERALDLPWDKYDAIIVPGYQALGDDVCKKLDDFAATGGTVIAVGSAGLRRDDFELRQEPPFKCMGISKINYVRSDMRSSYFKMDEKNGFERFLVTDLVYMDGNYVFSEYESSVKKYMKLVPPHMYGPPERCYYTVVTELPGITVNSFGKGKGVFIPWEPGKQYYKQGYLNTINLVADLLENILKIKRVEGNLSPMVEATVFERRDGSFQLLHLVNNSGHFGVTYFAPVPMADLTVTIPFAGKPGSVKSLVTGKEYEFTEEQNELTVKIPRLDLFECVKISK